MNVGSIPTQGSIAADASANLLSIAFETEVGVGSMTVSASSLF